MSFKIYLESGYDAKALKKNKMVLSPEEREEVMSRKAVWHDGPNGEETAAVWKTKTKSGQIKFICNTHRAWAIKDTLKAAINAFKFIKTTA